MLSSLQKLNLETMQICERAVPVMAAARLGRLTFTSPALHAVPRFFSTVEVDDSTERRRKRMMGIRTREEMAESARRYTENTGVDPHLSDDEDDLAGKTFTSEDTDELAELCLRRYRFYDPEGMTDRRLRVLV
ncbi:hypothetical protein FOZ63_033925, partial [Perkinsus olseni]